MLVKFMDNVPTTDFVVVLAGYRNLMTKMLNANLNLMSRMGNWIDFPDYDDGELLGLDGVGIDRHDCLTGFGSDPLVHFLYGDIAEPQFDFPFRGHSAVTAEHLIVAGLRQDDLKVRDG